jgi:hypothetical protein
MSSDLISKQVGLVQLFSRHQIGVEGMAKPPECETDDVTQIFLSSKNY